MNPTCLEDYGLSVSFDDLIEEGSDGQGFAVGFLQSFVPPSKWPESLIDKIESAKHKK